MSATLIAVLNRPGAIPNGLRVEAWDARGIVSDMIDVAQSDARGAFTMQLDDAYIDALLRHANPTLAFRIFVSGKPIAEAQPIVWEVSQQVTELTIPLATATTNAPAYAPGQSVVRGTVSHGNGTPAAGMIVRAFDRNLGANGFTDTELGQATTAIDGGYAIRYMMPTAGKLKPDLIVRVVASPTGTVPPGTVTPPPAPAVESPLISNAPTVAMVDLGLDGIVAPLLSEHRAVTATAQPVLDRGKLAIADLEPEHIDYVAGAAGLTSDRLQMIVDAAQLARTAGAKVDPEAWYALLRTGYQDGLEGLLDTPISVVRARLEQATDQNHMSVALVPQLDAITSAIQDAAVAHALPATGGTLISAAFGNALATPDVHQAFLRSYLGRDGSAADFWDAVRADATLAPHANDLETTLRLQILFGGFQPALAELRARRQAGTVTSHRDLARWQDSDWQSFLAKTGTPPGPSGATPAATATAYAAGLAAVVRAAFPTEYLRGRAAQPIAPLSLKFLPALAAANPTLDLRRPLPASPSWGSIGAADQPAARAEWDAFRRETRTFRGTPARTLLAATVAGNGASPLRATANRVLIAAADLDLENVTVDQYLGAHPAVLTSVPADQRLAVVGYLQSLQRIVRLAPTPEAADTLLGDGVDSALRIARMPRSQFVDRYQTALGGASSADKLYTTAYRVAATSQLALTTVVQSMAGTSPWAVRGGSTGMFEAANYGAALQLLQTKASAQTSATWPSLFGEDSWCDCDDCQAAWGPAAYFVDLLQMIDPAHRDHTPADKLFDRRPDLQYLPLTCDNTNTPIPTIDLVNEILEIRVAADLGIPVDVKSYDSTGVPADVLRAVPQNVIDGVYVSPSDSNQPSLAAEVYPFTLPFHRPLALVRTYLDQLGASYRDVYASFGPPAPGDLTRAEHLAAEDLGLSVRLFQVVAKLATDVSLAAAYGYSGQENPPWTTQLASVPTLLLRTGVNYDDLYALAWTYFVSPAAPAARPTLQDPAQCQIDHTSLVNTTDDTWDRLHRFIRLSRATAWSIADLDRVIFALGVRDPQTHAVTLDRDTLRKIGEATRAIAALGQPVADTLALWSDIDTWGSDSLYLARFANPTVAQIDSTTAFDLHSYDPINPQHKPSTGQDELKGASDKLQDHRPRVLAALGITSAELDAIWTHAISRGAIVAQADALLTLHDLTVLFRYTVLATGLELRIGDLVTLLTLSGADPFIEPAATLDFITLAGAIAASGTSIATLDYIYRHTILPGQGPAPSDSIVASALMKVWIALRTVRQDTAVTDDPDATLLATRLAAIQPPPIVTTIIAALDPATDPALRAPLIATYVSPTLPTAAQAIFGTPDPVAPTPPTDPSQQDAYDQELAAYKVAVTARKRDNQTALLGLISSWLRDSLSQSAVVSTVAGSLGLPDAMTRRMLVDWIPGDSGSALATLLGLAAGGLTGHFFSAAGFAGTETVVPPDLVSAQVTSDGTFHSVRWIGRLLPSAGGPQRLVVRTQGAVKLTVGAQSQTFAAGASVADYQLDITLSANELTTIQLEYDAGALAGQVDLLWYVPSSPTPQPIAAEYLFPENGLTVLDGGSGPGYVWRRAHKASLLVGGLGLGEDEIDYAQSAVQPFGAFALSALPMTPPGDPTTLFACWRALAAFVAVRASLPASDTSLTAALTWSDPTARLPQWAQKLCDAAGWDVDTVTSLLDATGFTDADWEQAGTTILSRLLAPISSGASIGDRLAALQTCIGLIKRVGADVTTLRGWAAAQPDVTVANQVIQAVRACYPDNTEWLSVAQTCNDTLRQLQRDALVAHLMARIQIGGAPPLDVNSLFEYFLIDVQMGACGQTSRIVQANASVQLFIQRILLDLESGIPATYIDPAQWEWNSEYRVWQANREIFLYPENWIDPELRVDKTPFFTDLQSQLAQGPLTSDNIEAAFLTYLEQLEDVARLRVCALNWQRETSHDSNPVLAAERTIDTLHVVARTPGAQPTYFYRTLLGVEQGGGGTEWTPWQKIDVDIQGDGDTGDVQMLLTTFNRRLYMFWAQFTEVPEPTQPGANQGESPPPPLTHWEIRLAWSTYRDGAWSAKQVTSDYVRSNRFVTNDKSDRKSFKDIVKDFEQKYTQARAAYLAMEAVVTGEKIALWILIAGQLAPSFDSAMDTFSNDYDLTDGAKAWIKTRQNELHSPNLATFEQRIANANQTFDKFLDDLYSSVERSANRYGESFSLAPPAQTLANMYAALTKVRGQRDTLAAKYEKLKKAYTDFKKGNTSLDASSETERRDHTLWVDSGNANVQVLVLRHDEAANPLSLGYFELSADGRSVSMVSDIQRRDITRQMPHHSKPDVNAFEVDTTKQTANKGLDLEGLPNLLGSVHDATFFHEHWLHHPVTAEHPRPFVIAKGSELDVALPDRKRTSRRRSWRAAEPIAGLVEQIPPANIIGGIDQLRTTSLLVDDATTTRTMDFAQSIAAETAFGIDQIVANPAPATRHKVFRFEPFRHPFIERLIKRLERDGVNGLLTAATQDPADADEGIAGGHFDNTFAPSHKYVATPYAVYDVDFRAQGAYSLYNWEVFFHAPFLIAARLMTDGQYADARTWLHYVFDPTTSSNATAPARYWNVQWFRDHDSSLDADQLMTALATNTPDNVVARIKAEIEQWHLHPADPHRIARLRTSAYQKAIVFKYLDNLIAWGDSLFSQNTIETINQATQLYVLASHLLGPRPQHVPQKPQIQTFCYDDVRGTLDELSDTVETMLHPETADSDAVTTTAAHSLFGISALPVISAAQKADPSLPQSPLVFCVPANSKLLGYFDTIDDRLFKIRNCMNIEGVVQQLPLFQPPIDPALLVRAAALGLDIGSILSDLNAPLPFQRFAVMIGKANELCAELRAFGNQLLGALEKQDAEALAMLRATQEVALLTAVRDVKKQQVRDAQTNKDALQKSREVTQAKFDYYASREFMNSWETEQTTLFAAGSAVQGLGGLTIASSSQMFVFPDFEIGPTGMGAHATASAGGRLIANSIKAFGESLNTAAQVLKDASTIAGTLGGHHRRQDDWDFQKNLATRELAQIDKQLAAADIKIAIANLELANQQLQIDNAQKIESTLRTKYTNSDLYQWMIGQVSTTYYQAYKLAYDLAKRAERCYQYELGIPSSGFIQFGYWDSLHKGLLAGDQLALDLKRLDASYLQNNRRDYEMMRQISLVLHDPGAFMALRDGGSCTFELPEELFDADYPGHYFRRIKNVGLTLPCVAGPYTPINCTLTLLASNVRTTAAAAGSYPERDAPNDARFSHSYGSIQSVATSHGQNDTGLFEVNFRDERYLPFEGAGAISRWRIDLPHDCNAFDFDTLADVVVKVSYTARDGGAPLASAARASLAKRRAGPDASTGITPPLQRMFRVRYEFSDAWIAFRNDAAKGPASLAILIDRDRFPYLFRAVKTLTITRVDLFATSPDPLATMDVRLSPPGEPAGSPPPIHLQPTHTGATVAHASWSATTVAVKSGADATWTIAVDAGSPLAAVRDLVVVVTYTASP